MKDAQISQEEDVRLAALRAYGIVDTAPEADFDEISQLAAELCGTPIALISLVEEDRQWFKSRTGTPMKSTPIEMSMCKHAIASGALLEIEDTTLDARTCTNPLVTGPDHIRFYAGALLIDRHGLALGTLCVLDRVPRRLSDQQRRALTVLARQVMRQIELRQALATGEVLRKEVDHRVKNSLQALNALIRIQSRSEPSEAARDALAAVQGRLEMISCLHEALYLADEGAVVSLVEFLEKVVRSSAGQMPQGIAVTCDLAPCYLESRDASSVGMIVNEAMANAAKYAFAGRDTGKFEVVGGIQDGVYTLICQDDGMSDLGAQSEQGTGIGMMIMQAAARQLGGNMEIFRGGQGYHLEFSWPLGTH